jgi:outer membrane protein TolC
MGQTAGLRVLTGVVIIVVGLLIPISGNAETLDDAWEAALATDHSLRAAHWKTQSAEQNFAAARSQRLPSLNVDGGYNAKNNPSVVNISELGLPVDQFPADEKQSLSYGANVNLPLYTSGKINHGIGAANHDLEAEKLKEAGAIQDLKMRVAEAYIAVLRTRRAYTTAESQVVSLEAHARDTENLFKQGLTDKNALLSARVALADAQQQALRAKNDVDIAGAAYNRLLGRELSLAVELEELEPTAPESDLPDLTRRALMQRPAVIALSHQAEALREQAAAERAGRGPQAKLSGGYNYDENRFQVNEAVWSVNLGVQWELFDGGAKNHRSIAIARQADALLEVRADLRSKIELEVRETWLEVHESRKRTEVTRQAVAQADENLQVARNLFKAGMATHTQVLDAERLRTTTYTNHDNASYDNVLAGLRLRRTLGEL